MATTLFFRDSSAQVAHRGRNDAKLNGSAVGWEVRDLLTTRGAAAVQVVSATSVLGPTSGIEPVGTFTAEWLSPPLAAAATISGTITFNLRMSESMSTANAGAQCVIERIDSTGAVISTVINSEKGTELGTSEAAQNWTGSPTSTNFNKGDRIRIRMAFNDAGGTMASGLSLLAWHDGPTAAASGDAFVTFTEDLTFMTTDPSGSQLFMTEVASGIVDQGTVEKEMWTSRGGGATTAVVNSATGFANPVVWTDSGGGTIIEWYSKRLKAFTLSGLVKANLRLHASTSNVGANMELAVVNDDGSGATVFGSGGLALVNGQLSTSEVARTIYISGQDIAVADGQRLRFRVRLDDSATAMPASQTGTFTYAGSAGATGDSWLQLEQTVTEFVPPAGDAGPHPLILTIPQLNPWALRPQEQLTEAPATAVPVADSDTGAGTDNATLVALIPGTDTGAGTETSALTAVVSDTDARTGTDTGTLAAALSDSDSGTGTESGAVSVPVSGSDSGTGSDTSSLVAAIPDSETGTGTDNGVVATAAIPDTDTGSGTETSTLVAVVADTDTGSGADSSFVSIPGTGVDAGIPLPLIFTLPSLTQFRSAFLVTGEASQDMQVSGTDSGIGTDNASLAATAPGSDTGTGTDNASLVAGIPATESGSGTDTASLVAGIPASDTGTSAENASLTALIGGSESGAGVDTGASANNLVGVDSGTGTDTAPAPRVVIFVTETVNVVEAAAIAAILSGSDTGVGGDIGVVTTAVLTLPTATIKRNQVGASVGRSQTGAAISRGGATSTVKRQSTDDSITRNDIEGTIEHL